ncbi:hypothetical protein Agabi119p4_5865 [Agaricus bisporus var. burnettii]|uniref:Uncharacterized protein n=1 Tax=Agaricus bisporus var. burnettii TaxID=192524 RepID=A0A8H7KGY7_AGABI|nr:hypothetical protein Agabi119p4_5865 [Agaricus bisporus var. burnettii]
MRPLEGQSLTFPATRWPRDVLTGKQKARLVNSLLNPDLDPGVAPSQPAAPSTQLRLPQSPLAAGSLFDPPLSPPNVQPFIPSSPLVGLCTPRASLALGRPLNSTPSAIRSASPILPHAEFQDPFSSPASFQSPIAGSAAPSMLSLLREATGSEHQSSEGAQDIQEVARPAGYLCEAEPPSQTLQLSEGGSTSQLLSFPEDDDSGDDIDTGQPMGDRDGRDNGDRAMKGNYPYLIKRSRPLREAAGDSRAGSKRFRRVMKEIIVRRKCLYSMVCAEGGIDGVVQAENLSVETGCWLYVVGQHTTATTPFVHYVSPRFREDATKEVNIIHNNFSRTISALISSRRRTVTDVTMELDSTRARLVEMKERRSASKHF